jgi:uncharacterized protein (DUF111 family)
MKKSRPAVKITCICNDDKRKQLIETLLKETTTIGVRETKMARTKLKREIKTANTPLGTLRVKISKKGDEILKITPEYEDIKLLAKDKGIPLIKAYEIIKAIDLQK